MSTITGCLLISFRGVLCREALEVSALSFRHWRLGGRVTGARMWLFCLPSGQIVAALSLDAGCELGDTVGLLEDCYFADIQIGGSRAQAYAHAMAVQLGAADGQADQGFSARTPPARLRPRARAR